MPFRLDLTFWVRMALTAVLVVGAVLSMGVVHGGPTLPHDKLRRTSEAMYFTPNYRVDIDYQPAGGEMTFFGDVEVNGLDTFAVHIPGDEGINDYLVTGNRVYRRLRVEPLSQPLWQGPTYRGLKMYPELNPYFFPVTAVESIPANYETEELGRETHGAIELVHYRAKTNPAYAYQRGYAVWLVKTMRAFPIKEPSLGSAPPDLDWIQRYAPSLRGRLDMQEEALRFFVDNPATVDIWAHPKDLVPYVIQITYPPGSSAVGAPEGVVRFRFRDFNHDFRLSPDPREPETPPVVVQ